MALFTLPLLFIGWDERLCAMASREDRPLGDSSDNPLGPTVTSILACLLPRPWLLSLASLLGLGGDQKAKKIEADSPQLTPESVIPSSASLFSFRVLPLCGSVPYTRPSPSLPFSFPFSLSLSSLSLSVSLSSFVCMHSLPSVNPTHHTHFFYCEILNSHSMRPSD